MRQIDLKDLRGRVEDLRGKVEIFNKEIVTILELLAQPDIIIADFPDPEKKVRKKRMKKESPTPTINARQSGLIVAQCEREERVRAGEVEPKRARRGKKAGYHLGPHYIEPTLREGETPV